MRHPKWSSYTLVFLVIFGAHVCSLRVTSYDSRWSIPTAVSIIREGDTDLDEYTDLLKAKEFKGIETIDGHSYTIFPIGASLLALPFAYAFDRCLDVAVAQFPELCDYIKRKSPRQLDAINVITLSPIVELFIASVIVALTGLLIYRLARLFLPSWQAWIVTLVFAFQTSAWSTASRGLWQHGPSMLMLVLALSLLLAARRRPGIVQFVSLPLAFSFVVRPTNGVSVLLLSVFVFMEHRRFFWRYLLWALPVAIPFVWFNFHVYGAPLSPYYLGRHFVFEPSFLEALAGNLISPARGLFVFSPVLLFSLYGMAVKLRTRPEPLDVFLISVIVCHWLVISLFPHWWAGHSYGPRLFCDMVPFLLYFLIFAVCAMFRLPRLRRVVVLGVFGCLAGISFLIHFRGATTMEVDRWNREPVNVDLQPARVWDWSDAQFLRGLGRASK